MGRKRESIAGQVLKININFKVLEICTYEPFTQAKIRETRRPFCRQHREKVKSGQKDCE
jgi:hypothetical protein